jgi:hypothetical protein
MYIRHVAICSESVLSVVPHRFRLSSFKSSVNSNTSFGCQGSKRYLSLSQCLRKDEETVIIGGVSKKLTAVSKPELVPTKYGMQYIV